MNPNLKPISTRPKGQGREVEPNSPPSSSGVVTPKGRKEMSENGSPGMGSDSSSPWKRFFRGGSKYPNSDADSFDNSPRNLMGFSPKATSSPSFR